MLRRLPTIILSEAFLKRAYSPGVQRFLDQVVSQDQVVGDALVSETL